MLLWRWQVVGAHVQPVVKDYFLGPAREVCEVRDALHIARGGSFVDRAQCPDNCVPAQCRHHGEPLNASGKRERDTGPASCRVSQSTSYAANFGGMVRMLKADSKKARAELRRVCRSNSTSRGYVEFVWSHLPNEEANHFTAEEWRECAARHSVPTTGLGRDALVAAVRARVPGYRGDLLAQP